MPSRPRFYQYFVPNGTIFNLQYHIKAVLKFAEMVSIQIPLGIKYG
jgi:hypothetical protein